MKPTIIDSTQCHLWTDALHARQLAREALNKWDRGTYVRMSVITVWIALETSCQDALSAPNIGYRFKEDLDKALSAASLEPVDWSQGIWQKVRQLQELRKTYVHRFLALPDMFPEASVADEAIETVRLAVENIYVRVAKFLPTWFSLDEAHGWQTRASMSGATLTVGHHGAKLDDPNTVKIYIVINGQEKLTTVLPSGYDPKESVDQLLSGVKVPISAIRVYDNGHLVQDLIVNMRGNS